jgi:hypothetical protein
MGVPSPFYRNFDGTQVSRYGRSFSKWDHTNLSRRFVTQLASVGIRADVLNPLGVASGSRARQFTSLTEAFLKPPCFPYSDSPSNSISARTPFNPYFGKPVAILFGFIV